MTEDTADEQIIDRTPPTISEVDDLDQYWNWLEESQIEDMKSEELRILEFLLKEYFEDKKRVPSNQAGWRNKYNIAENARISQKKIYSENGPIESLLEVGFLEIRDSPNRWGGQKYNYRIHINENILYYLDK